ncbi:MAG: MiaB/RimO family radical SAM methylthiotransferase [Spirochaetaceae bacterium]|jgi:threonylcarbamoyladenosine tRNA methylthiotransferase MtaB|nr:MiaB/RimO family radical SAM methylthiotransferase [Spirochaetaceae bacterium]
MNKIAFYTLGCKLNIAESEELAAVFKESGFNIKHDGELTDAGIVIVNTCTVTSKAEQKARRLIRSLLAAPDAPLIFVTGCYARLNKVEIEALDTSPPSRRRVFVIEKFERKSESVMPALTLRSRAFVKIQDGCNNKCAYCRVRLARGSAHSENSGVILAKLLKLEAEENAEAVLTGVNIAQYREGALDLASLLSFLLEKTQRIALRLASLEPAVFTNSFFQQLQNPRIRPHFHLSIQSASRRVLNAMHRDYSVETLNEIIARLRTVKDDPFIACDIIAGFPGETADDFEQTFVFCAKAEFAWIHAFPFSPRPGTEAAALRPRVSERETRMRVERLIALATESGGRYRRRWAGREVEAVVEKRLKDGKLSVTTENYLKLKLNAASKELPCAGRAFRCVVS